MSLDDEAADSCTGDMPRFYITIAEQCFGVFGGGSLPMVSYVAEAAAVLGDLTPVLCSQGHVRVTRSEIPQLAAKSAHF